jgi:alkylmercury lyase
MANTRTEREAEIPVLGGNELDFGPYLSRLLIQTWRSLAKGQPIPPERVSRIANELGVELDVADAFLRRVSERHDNDHIVGVMGLSLDDHPHRFTVDDVELRTWCAGDALFLPAMLGRTADVGSASPVTGDVIRLTVSPDGIVNSDPAGAALSVPGEDPGQIATAELAAIWSTFCHHIFFFASKDEGRRWAADRDNMAILPVRDAYQLVTALWRKVRWYADQDRLPGQDQA